MLLFCYLVHILLSSPIFLKKPSVMLGAIPCTYHSSEYYCITDFKFMCVHYSSVPYNKLDIYLPTNIKLTTWTIKLAFVLQIVFFNSIY